MNGLTEPDVIRLRQGIALLSLDLTEGQIEQLLAYAERILKWNKVYNLTAITSSAEVVTHHLLDCLAVLPPMMDKLKTMDDPRLLDVGSGAGLPAIPLAICFPFVDVTMVDTVQKKAAFMQQACASLKLANARAVHTRIEAYHPQEKYSAITSRAFSTMTQFISLSQHLLVSDGFFAAMKGRREVDEKVPAGWTIESVSRIEVPFLTEERHLFLVKR